MSSASDREGSQGSPRIVVRVEHKLLNEEAQRRVEQVVQAALDEELAKQPAKEFVSHWPDEIIIGQHQDSYQIPDYYNYK